MLFILAIIQVETPIAIEDDNKARVCLPDNDNPIPEDKKGCYGTGWGVKSQNPYKLADVLQQVIVDRVSKADCNSKGEWEGDIRDDQTCAGVKGGKKDTCQNDSGGSLVCQNEG